MGNGARQLAKGSTKKDHEDRRDLQAMASSFCIGGAMIMGANGLTLTGADAHSDCLMLWTEAFTVNSFARAVAANVGVLLLAVLAQFLTTSNANRMQLAKQYAKLKRMAIISGLVEDPENGRGYETASQWRRDDSDAKDASEQALAKALTLPTVSNWEHFGDSVLHGCRIFVAYLLMLAAMTYDVALISSIIAGFMIGYFVFTKDTTKVPESADPCCS